MKAITNSFSNKRVLITGACGTIGSALVSVLQNLTDGPKQIICLDNNENEVFYHHSKFQNHPIVTYISCDIRDYAVMSRYFKDIDIVYHCAALKHVIINEFVPEEVVATNIKGTLNVIHASEEADVARVIFTSSDKAVNPTSVMGTSKLMGERLITAANNRNNRTIFASTRFGNVLGSNGSVFKIFNQQITDNSPFTLTDLRMSRFVMSVEEACNLVLEATFHVKGGEVFITKMPVLEIVDLAHAMFEIRNDCSVSRDDLPYVVIGKKPGEKLYEELMSSEECGRAIELEKYFSVLPAFSSNLERQSYDYDTILENQNLYQYNSELEEKMSVKDIKNLLFEYKLF